MSELVPIPLDVQLRRAFLEYERDGRIFDLPRDKFFRGLPGLDTAVTSNGHRASTPLGPAAGPHTQLLQNIVLCWLGGARIIELKTVQVLDQLKIPRPCIDSATVTYNVEWSQELRLEQSLREYVSAAMFLAILKAARLLGEEFPYGDTVFDMSAGYNLAGITSPLVRAWIEGMKNAAVVIDNLRGTLTGRFRQYRDLPFPTAISDTMTLSTFHGCPAEEIEGIVTFLLRDMGVNVCVKMNPTLLGREEVAYLLHDVLGYREIELADDAFANDLKFDQALDLVPRLQRIAAGCGKQLSLKFSNTLVVRNHRQVFREERMYMSGPPLHVLTLNLVRKFREHVGAVVPLSFSAGLNAHNMADMVAMNFVPVTTCTDLLKAGGYGRLHKYMENLGAAMRAAGANTIPEFVIRAAGQGAVVADRAASRLHALVRELSGGAETATTRAAQTWITHALTPKLHAWIAHPEKPLRQVCSELAQRVQDIAREMPASLTARFAAELARLEPMLVEEAGLLNTPVLVERATADPRYRFQQNQAAPRKTASHLELFDCLACDKCVPACPNDANFLYEHPPVEWAYDNYDLLPGGKFKAVAGGVFTVRKSHQFANYADACNECGNCDVLCPELGSPHAQKPRFFGSPETYGRHAGQNGFYVAFENGQRTIRGIIAGKSCTLALDASADCARFEDDAVACVIQPSRNRLVSWRAKDGAAPKRLDLLPYFQLKFLLEAVSDPRHVNYVNVAAVKEHP